MHFMSDFIDNVKELATSELELSLHLFLIRFADKLMDFPMPQSIRVCVPDEDEEDEETLVAVWKTSDRDIVPLTIDRIGCVFNCVNIYDVTYEDSNKFIVDLLAIRSKLI
jgi:hypothetical protein